MKTTTRRAGIMTGLAVGCLLSSSQTAVHSCQNKKQKLHPHSSRKTQKGKSGKTTPQPSPVKSISIEGYPGKLYIQKRIIEIYVGDIAATSDLVGFCKEISAKALKQYSDYTDCKVLWEVVAHNETVSGVFVFRRTAKGIERVG